MLTPYIDMDELQNMVLSYKSLLFEWSQKNKKELVFKTESDDGLDPNINYTSQIYLDNKSIAKARAVSKKKAEEKAAKIATSILKPSKTKKDA
jgi:ribonuclease-3